jgi:phage terminase large subunit
VSEVIERTLALRGAAKELLERRESEVLLAGPAGTGKSYACLFKIHMMALLNPGSRYLVVRKTHRSLSATGLVTFREHVLPEALRTGLVRWYGGSGEKPAQYVYDNGSSVVVGGMDNADKVMSAEYDCVYVQEATELTPDDWEKITSRLRNGKVSFQQLLADCNPQQPSHWLKKRCDEGTTVMLYARHEDNPRLFSLAADGTYAVTPEGVSYISKLDALTGVRKERLRHGRWAAAEGIIYADWRPDIHLSDRKLLPREWTRIWSVDFGFTNPFVWQMWAVDPDGRLWLEKEIYRTQRLVEDHAKDILEVVTHNKDRSKWIYPRPRVIICDHDAEDRATLERHLGMGTVAAWKSVSDGIQAMQVRLRPAKDGKPRMFVCRDSLVARDQELIEAGRPVGFAQEVESYVWEPAPDGKPSKDRPLKDNDHSMDAARYAVAYLDLAPRPRIRIMG